MGGFVRRVRTYVAHHGVGYTVKRACEKLHERVFHEYDHRWRTMRPDDAELARERATPMPGVGRISLVVPVYNTRPDLLDALAESFMAQTWPDWEACLYDGLSTRADTVMALDRIAGTDSRFRVVHGDVNEGISGNSNRALAMATGAWIALCDHDDLLSPDALYRVAEVIRDQQPDMIYSDEDKVTEDGVRHMEPHFKPDFCPDNLRSGNYICHLMVLRRTLIDQAGGFRPDFDGSQDHDLALRCIEHTTRVVHIPRVLYHWRQVGSSMSHQNLMRCVDAARRAVEEHMTRIGWPGRVTAEEGTLRLHYDLSGNPRVTVVVLDSADEQTLTRCVDALRSTDHASIEWLVVSAHQPRELPLPNAAWVQADPRSHRYAAMNQAMQAATGDILAFVDASVTVDDPSWLREALMYAQREDVGAVTPVLHDSRGRITHGGFAVGVAGGAQCRSKGLPCHAGGWHNMMRTSHNVAAVSGACLVVRRDHALPFDEHYHGGLGAADWCMRQLQAGRRQVYTPFASGQCTQETLLLTTSSRDADDLARFHGAWGREPQDPCYSTHFSRRKADYSLRSDG